ncbi:hypothetical protein KEM55_006616, partial [Ascosphaera atra]
MSDSTPTGDRVLCYNCSRQYSRAHGGLICPHCGSDFVEVVGEIADTTSSSRTSLTSSQLEEPEHPQPQPEADREPMSLIDVLRSAPPVAQYRPPQLQDQQQQQNQPVNAPFPFPFAQAFWPLAQPRQQEPAQDTTVQQQPQS